MLDNKEAVELSTQEPAKVSEMTKGSDLDFYGFSKGESDDPQAEEKTKAAGEDASESPKSEMEKMMYKMMQDNMAKMMEEGLAKMMGDKESSMYKMLRKMMDEEKDKPEMDKSLTASKNKGRGRDALLEWLNK